ncbi:DUF4030 domain-containing protein [Heyndrickxia ginsengihumi]|uniref:DUF4030 domain-containing protein n=1 Tax=Heyndrickxia ginsengihumi TaxID=363870 RepID=UPI003D1EFCD6
MEVEVPSSEKRITELKPVITTTAKKYNLDKKYSVKIRRMNMNQQKLSQRWSLSAMEDELLGKKEFKVKGIAFSNTSDMMKITIKTNIRQSSASKQDDVLKIQQQINALIHSNKVQQQIKGDRYEINILSQDNQKLN